LAFPVRAVTQPAALEGQSNGRLDPGILKATPGQAGGPLVELVEPATRAWRALTAAALEAGHVLKISGPSSAYRTYAMQEYIFRQRYTTTPNGTRPRRWEGQLWYKKPGVAAAAVPGTSNHGWGLAVDVGEERDGDSGTESLDAGTLEWLRVNAERFGFSWEV
jgi:LAS superfamily LD-carboxypeptidase LdcB